MQINTIKDEISVINKIFLSIKVMINKKKSDVNIKIL